ncbi:hypothetical protein IU449_28495 [Nocardia higoensis]|uniref:Uncharacterized protein n=1 Tax=Nocardia higoensis TaxID=228599 RepID=A0ABS0DJ03_9NOCA|nr:hypothetical protein [Nocardia higoensis]MBF6358440.1 hypothetical protein [Nocardia higoensis]
MTAMTDLDFINANLMGSDARSAFGSGAKPGDQLTGEIVSVERRHRRHRETGELLYWVNRKPTPAESGQPVYDSVLLVQTDQAVDDDDDGMRALYLDRDVQKAIRAAVQASGAGKIELGGQILGLLYVGPDPKIKGAREYQAKGYQPPAA